MKRAMLVLAVAACNTPTPSLRLALAGPPSQECPSTDCAKVDMICDAVMSIRIVDPMDPASPYLSQCVQVSTNQPKNMCAIASVDLDPTPIPVRDLEVQVALYPAKDIPSDPLNQDKLLCPTKIGYSAGTGFPVEQSPTPALGGHAFYHPGDEKVIVTLGCTDLATLNESCVSSDLVTIAATVDDFETRASVMGGSPSLADQLWVSVGEPHAGDTTFVLYPRDLRPLDRVTEGPIPTWGDEIEYPFHRYVCLEVLEVEGQSTATLRCTAVTGAQHLDLRGVWMGKPQLNELLRALGLTAFPEGGLTVGMVVDEGGNPVGNARVLASVGTVGYLSDAHDKIITGVTATTSSNGIFVSRDAPFGAEFSTDGAGQPASYGIGGRVAGRITIVILKAGGLAL